MEVLMYAFFSTLIISILIIASNTLHGHFTNDIDVSSIQKFHITPVPRIGGLALLIGLFITWSIQGFLKPEIQFHWIQLILAALPIFLVGMQEDITKKVSARFRLYISFLSAGLVCFLVHVYFKRFDWPWLDTIIASSPAFLFVMTLVVIASTIHAMNLIDGFNGLMLGVSAIMFAAIAIVSYFVKDALVFNLSLTLLGAMLGLMVVNFPFGKIFAGDSGAYLIGLLLGTTVLMLVQRNREVSAWFPCLLVIYPLFETVFSIYRKVILRKKTAMQPDGVHLHMLIYKRITRHQSWSHKWMRNPMTSPYLWLLSLLGIAPAVLFWNSTFFTMFFCVVFSLFYLKIYWYLALFKNRKGFFRVLKLTEVHKKIIKEIR